jgi:hypothetical protein
LKGLVEGFKGRVAGRFLLPRTAALGAISLAIAGFAASPAFAVDKVDSGRQFDPRLSLVGGCEAPESLDEEEDPGCLTTPPSSAHPAELFARPTSVATDFYGNMYVGSFGKALTGSEGRVDVFDPEGVFITEVVTPAGPEAVQVDSKGNLYVAEFFEGTTEFVRYEPTVYDGGAGEIAYGSPVTFYESLAPVAGMALNPANDHLFINGGVNVVEFNSAEDGNTEEAEDIDLEPKAYGTGMAVDATRGRIYASENDDKISVFNLASPHERLDTFEASAVPENNFVAYLSLAVDEGTGNLFLLDGSANRIYEFAEDGTYVSTLERSFQVFEGAQIGIDNGPFSQNGALSSQNGRYLYVPSNKTGTGHSYAFNEPQLCAPKVQELSDSGPTDREVKVRGSVDACGIETTYRFEYTTLENFEAEGFTGAAVVEGGKLPAASGFKEVSQTIAGLEGGTQYRFRIVATNEEGTGEAEGSFATYPNPPLEPELCPNRVLRVGLALTLPDCRAYEMVTPPDTNGRAPVGTSHIGYFTNRQVSPAGDKVPFRVEGGTIPGLGGTGSYLGDPYLSTRGQNGWTTTHTGPTGAESVGVGPGGSSPDEGYLFWTAEGRGSKVIEGKFTLYLRYPDGHSELVGDGSLGVDPEAVGMLISEGGEHTLLATGVTGGAVQLEPEAAPDGTQAIYDRALDGDLRVVSLLPGDVPFGPGQNAVYMGASLDGKGVAFKASNKLYLRYDNSETFEIGEGVTFAGVAEGGNRIFYVEGGKLLRFDALTEEVTPFSTGTVTPVNVSPDGSAAYFISTGFLTTAANPNGVKAKAGKENLYLSEEGAISFVGTVTERDVDGTPGATEQVDGLGLWTVSVEPPSPGRLANVPARTTPDGDVLLFQSRAPLTGFDPDGHPQVYRYDSSNEELDCLSCNPTTSSASGDASLQSAQRGTFALFYPTAWLENLRADGRRAFFQSIEPLVPGDTDGLQDVYEWEKQGVGGCTLLDGCVYLITSGHSIRDDYLWAVDKNGDNVFVLTSDLLVPADADETVSIYDVRAGGGFPDATPPPNCQGEGCRPQILPPPALPGASTPVGGSGDNFKPPRSCPKGKRKVKRGGKVRCVKKNHRRQAGSKGKGAHR